MTIEKSNPGVKCSGDYVFIPKIRRVGYVESKATEPMYFSSKSAARKTCNELFNRRAKIRRVKNYIK